MNFNRIFSFIFLGQTFAGSFEFSLSYFRKSTAFENSISDCFEIKSIERIESSFAGIGKSTRSGSVLVSTIAMIEFQNFCFFQSNMFFFDINYKNSAGSAVHIFDPPNTFLRRSLSRFKSNLFFFSQTIESSSNFHFVDCIQSFNTFTICNKVCKHTTQPTFGNVVRVCSFSFRFDNGLSLDLVPTKIFFTLRSKLVSRIAGKIEQKLCFS